MRRYVCDGDAGMREAGEGVFGERFVRCEDVGALLADLAAARLVRWKEYTSNRLEQVVAERDKALVEVERLRFENASCDEDTVRHLRYQIDGLAAAVVKFLKRLREEGMTAPYDLDDALARYGGDE